MSEILNTVASFPISKREWPKLCDLFRENWPRHILSFYTLKTHIDWANKDPKFNVTIYSCDENWEQHGTYIILENSKRDVASNVLLNTLDPLKNKNLMENALKNLPNYQELILAGFVDQVRPIVLNYLSESCSDDEITCQCDTLLYHLPLEESLKLTFAPKAGYNLRPLSLNDMKKITDFWPSQYAFSDVLIKNIIQHNITLGAYDERTGQLCGWIMQEQIGSIGYLQVLDSYKRQGLGKELICQMAILFANADMDATATVLCTNRPFRNLLQKLGFKIIDRVFWYHKKSKTIVDTKSEDNCPHITTSSELLLSIQKINSKKSM